MAGGRADTATRLRRAMATRPPMADWRSAGHDRASGAPALGCAVSPVAAVHGAVAPGRALTGRSRPDTIGSNRACAPG